jgi:signal transduction histidine kinase/CheY-like chemotaxis protein
MHLLNRLNSESWFLNIFSDEIKTQRWVGMGYVAVLLMAIVTRSLPQLIETGWSAPQWVVFPIILTLLTSTIIQLAKAAKSGRLLLNTVVWLLLPLFAFGLLTVGYTPFAMIPGSMLIAIFLLPSQHRRFYLYLGLLALLIITLQKFTDDQLLFGLRSLSAAVITGLVFIRLLDGEKPVLTGGTPKLRDFVGLIAALCVLVVPVLGLVSDRFVVTNPEGILMAAAIFVGHTVIAKYYSGFTYRAPLFVVLLWLVVVYELYMNQEHGMLFLPAATVAVYFTTNAKLARRFMLSLVVVILLGFVQFFDVEELELFPRLFILALVCWLVVELVVAKQAQVDQKEPTILNPEGSNPINTLLTRTVVFTVLITTLVLMALVPIIQHIDRSRYQEQLQFAASHLDLNLYQFNQQLMRFVDDIHLRTTSSLSRNYLTGPTANLRLLLEQELVSVVENDPFVVQARLLDLNGLELIRANRSSVGAYAVEPTELQDKSNRTYFVEAKALGLDEIYVSEIDLNVEHGVVEVPHLSVIRFAVPAFDTLGNKRGVWVVNYDAAAFLQLYAQYDPHKEEQNFIANKSGSMVLAPEGFPLWADSLNLKDGRVGDFYPALWEQVALLEVGDSAQVFEFEDKVAFYQRFDPSEDLTTTMQQELNLNRFDSKSFSKIKLGHPLYFIQILPKTSLSQFALIGSPITLFWLAVTFILILLVAFSIASLLARSEELSKQGQKLESALSLAEESAEAKGRFLATMSHEIRTPLNGVLGMLVLAKEECVDTQLKSHLNLIESSANALRNIVDDILDISRLEQGGIMLEKRSFSPKSMLEEVSALFKPVAQQKGVELNIQSQLTTNNLLGDNHRIKQILSNLVGNAIKFTEQGRVTIRSELIDPQGSNPRWQIAVEDTGIGMSAEQIATLFERFTQADDSISRRFGGSGLGLSISKQLAELMQGTIAVTSKEGKGSCFTLELPVELASTDQIQTEVQALNPFESVKELAGKRLLVVDDSPTNRMVAQGLLNKMGMKVTTADGGQAALAAIRASLPDLILLDIHMPEMDGLAVAKAIRAGEAGDKAKALPIIALTAAAFESDRDNAKKAGMNGFLSKPINPAELAAELLDKLAD